jgi:hypothetical protein
MAFRHDSRWGKGVEIRGNVSHAKNFYKHARPSKFAELKRDRQKSKPWNRTELNLQSMAISKNS